MDSDPHAYGPNAHELARQAILEGRVTLTDVEKNVLRCFGTGQKVNYMDLIDYFSACATLKEKKLLQQDDKGRWSKTILGQHMTKILIDEFQRVSLVEKAAQETKEVREWQELEAAREDNINQITDIMQRISLLSFNARRALFDDIDKAFDRHSGVAR